MLCAGMAHEIPEGELVLLATGREKIDVLTLGVSQGVEAHPGFTRKILHHYLSLEPALRLVKGVVTLEGREYPAASWIQTYQTFSLARKHTRTYVGKEKILAFLQEDKQREYASHAAWIERLHKPYENAMPKVKNVSYVDTRPL